MNLVNRLTLWVFAPTDAVIDTTNDVTADNVNLDDCSHAGVARPIDRGQATTEYALVLLGAAMIALLVVTWATAGGGAGKIGRLFDRVIDTVLSKVS